MISVPIGSSTLWTTVRETRQRLRKIIEKDIFF